ncbi:sensor histidine kinase [Pseudoduganella namucuonensis]|uniref:histidine kinase n=1 Tax=Pseudoduganella namucuonensis TaxID=1035707 RepID=A0A1I7IN48_9BURK|nr:HAMP domain-containing sensor histidine kinase [Pseudoduganella namucuonensis]SFU74306.1 Signal transduction histidine kinase [Pseudoduganella namucuonensis]
MSNPSTLGEFILANLEPILMEWESFARTIEPPALTMDDDALRDHAREMLLTVAHDLRQSQTEEQQSLKAQGQGGTKRGPTAAETHAEARLLSGYTVEQLVSEYRALRASVLRLWTDATERAPSDLHECTRFNEAIDQALAESVARYARMVKQSQNMFLAILGHDLRNPLGAIISGASFMMGASDLSPKYMLVSTRMYTSGQRMSKLINDLIDFTRTHQGTGIPVRLSGGNFMEVCRNVVAELQISHPDRAIELTGPGAIELLFDNGRMAQVMSNLIGNALQYGAADAPVGVVVQRDAAHVRIAIHNNGPILEPGQLIRVFEPFMRFAATEPGQEIHSTNLGIGLYIAREIVHAHGGMIAVESIAGEGTTFTISLPVPAAR